ncbi:MAG: hypothetical protein E6Z03_01470 [Negativicoccus succinicivorans]|uniref:hypothetical protein n=1 Tax=Negativicoccus succinicivorans TaxID=620903 RepID=UPI00290985AB|nr:hypothetical protein [Negativicoccus succinicivorans]MDU5530542.1 hypothetical protein [Negativicoccus succinicivorans]MDU5591220.1 hypothetical protein [Escherichia coli]MDU5942770.1 hypothetical protein [Negativicoccus succinicivorans]
MLDEQAIQSGDELLGRNATPAIIVKAEQWLTHFAAGLGVEADDIRPSFIVQQLGAAYAYREVCRQKAYAAPAAWVDSQQGDYYAKKLAFYEQQVLHLERKITAQDLTGGKFGTGYRSTQIARG